MDDNEVAKYAGLYAMADPVTAVAVAIAEHGGGTVSETAVNRNTNGSTDTGLWQINSVHQRTHPTWSTAWLKDPKNNAEAMAVVSKGGADWTPWSTYKDGKYRAYLERAETARGNVSGSGGLGSIPNPLEVVDDVAGAVGNLAQSLGSFFTFLTDPNTWRRVALVVLGGAVVVVGVGVLARGTEVGQTVEGIAKKVA